MGHAGAIISGGSGTSAEKMAAFARVGVPVARIPSEIPGLLAAAMKKRKGRAAKPAKAARAKAKVKTKAKTKTKAKAKKKR
jgi:hypothetical protein